MSLLTILPSRYVESPEDMETICPKKLFIYCENNGITRINHLLELVWETENGERLEGYDELLKYQDKDKRRKRPTFIGWYVDVN